MPEDPTQPEDGVPLTQSGFFDSLLGGSSNSLNVRSKRPAAQEPQSGHARKQLRGPDAAQAHTQSAAQAAEQDGVRGGSSTGSDRSVSALAHLNGVEGPAANLDDGEGRGPSEPHKEEQQEEPETLTATLQEGLADMVMRVRSIEAKIQELTQVGVQELDAIKARFVAEMNRACEELRGMCEYQQAAWEELSSATLHESGRLEMAKQLVERLSCAAAGALLQGGNTQ